MMVAVNVKRSSHRRARAGFLPTAGLGLLLGLLLIMAIEAAFAPWIYTVGHVRFLPVWAGSGEAHGKDGVYRIYLWFVPSLARTADLPSTRVTGAGYVCTPAGRSYSLMVTGGAPGQIWTDMDGHSFHIDARHTALTSPDPSRRPELSFSGKWDGARLVMTDDASITHAFLPDGSLSTRVKAGADSTAGAVPVTFAESWWWNWHECPEP